MIAAASVEPQSRPRHRWWGLVAIVFGLQLGLIFWLGARTPVHPRQAAPAPTLQLAGGASAELLALNDPTLFALPHQQGFSGQAWLKVPQRELQSFDWSEPPRWLPLPMEQLGTAFSHFIQTNDFNALPTSARSEPDLTLPEPAPLAFSHQRSELRLQSDLARRRLIGPPELPSFRHTDILTNSIVQMLVDAEGRTVSFTLLPPGSGSKEADRYALNAARAARFEPVSGSGPDKTTNRTSDLTWGQMVFEWHTLPMPPTNAPAAGP